MKVFGEFLQITEERSKLPIASFKDVITSTIESHQVLHHFTYFCLKILIYHLPVRRMMMITRFLFV